MKLHVLLMQIPAEKQRYRFRQGADDKQSLSEGGLKRGRKDLAEDNSHAGTYTWHS
jgi:hypothetical protein